MEYVELPKNPGQQGSGSLLNAYALKECMASLLT